MKNARVMPNIRLHTKLQLAYFRANVGYFGHIFWDIDFEFVLPSIFIKISRQTNCEGHRGDPRVPEILLAYLKDLIEMWKMLKIASKNIVPSQSYDFLKIAVCLCLHSQKKASYNF